MESVVSLAASRTRCCWACPGGHIVRGHRTRFRDVTRPAGPPGPRACPGPVGSTPRTLLAHVPRDLRTRTGTFVYLRQADGSAHVMGRVVSVQASDDRWDDIRIRILSASADEFNSGGVLKGAPASLDLRDALTLMVSPDTLDEEALLARQAIWPSVRLNILPNLVDALIREVATSWPIWIARTKSY